MTNVTEMAKELGQALGRTEEYQALRRAAASLDEDRELVTLRNDLERVESEIVSFLQADREPTDDLRERYDALLQDLQVKPAYQRLVAAQANFDKLLHKVNETISSAVQEGSRSRIILP